MQFKEIDLLEKIEKLTNPLKDEGEWITYLDLVESGEKLLVKEQSGPGKCGTECKTVQKAAVDILEDIDTDIAEKLWQVDLSLPYQFLFTVKKRRKPMPFFFFKLQRPTPPILAKTNAYASVRSSFFLDRKETCDISYVASSTLLALFYSSHCSLYPSHLLCFPLHAFSEKRSSSCRR